MLYDGGSWINKGIWSFESYRGKQYYRNKIENNVRSLRIYIPGLADVDNFGMTDDNDQPLETIMGNIGEIQLFELFEGVDITYSDIIVEGQSVIYGSNVIFSDKNRYNVSITDLTVGGNPADSNLVFSKKRDETGWTNISGGTSADVNTHTVTSVTLYYRITSGNQTQNPDYYSDETQNIPDRMYPFFTFFVVRP
jgi:hypothetical protein